jgi:hypothetical protein
MASLRINPRNGRSSVPCRSASARRIGPTSVRLLGFRILWGRQRLARCGYADGEALWDFTINLLRPHLRLFTRVAIKLRRAQVLAGGEIDRVVRTRLMASARRLS